MKKFLSFTLIAMLLISAFGIVEADDEYNVEEEAVSVFTDMEINHWAYPYVEFLTSQNIIAGMGDGTFAPEETLTRGQYIKLVICAYLSSSVDVDRVITDFDHWAAPYVKLAESYGIIESGSVTMENVDEPISRMEMVTIISLADISILHNELQSEGNDIYFTDITWENTSKTERALLAHAYLKEFVTGYEDGTFGPDNFMTRAEAATIIYRYYWQETSL